MDRLRIFELKLIEFDEIPERFQYSLIMDYENFFCDKNCDPNVLVARLIGLTPAQYIHFAGSVLGAEISPPFNIKYYINQETRQFLRLLNTQATIVYFDHEHPNILAEIEAIKNGSNTELKPNNEQ